MQEAKAEPSGGCVVVRRKTKAWRPRKKPDSAGGWFYCSRAYWMFSLVFTVYETGEVVTVFPEAPMIRNRLFTCPPMQGIDYY